MTIYSKHLPENDENMKKYIVGSQIQLPVDDGNTRFSLQF